MPGRRVLSVGQCGADHDSIARALQTQFGAEVVPLDDAADALAELGRGTYDLVLVNRVLDRDGTSGLDLVARIEADAALRRVPVMLVSNYPDAQQQAVALGALPGFGKAALRQAAALKRLRAVLG